MPNVYTYDDFMKAANDSGLANSFDDNDLSIAQKYPEFGLGMLSLRKDLNGAQTDEQKLLVNEAMNQLRKNYGTYWTGDQGNRSYAASRGSQIQGALDDIGSYGAFEYRNNNEYQKLLDRVINKEDFTYDPLTDPIFSSYKKVYNREGDRAAKNALATAAAATGGRASSWATTAAQQANNYYAGKLADAIPQLRSAALEEYNNRFAQLLQSLNAMDTERSQDFAEYQDRFNQLQQRLTDLRAQDDTDYSRYLDMLNAEYQRERDVVDDQQKAFENALNVYQLTGQVTGPLADYLSGLTPAAAGGGGGGGGGGYSYGGGYGTYRGGLSSNANTTADEAAQKELDDILDKYKDSNGRITGYITKIADYQRIKELTGLTDEEILQAGVQYAYPVEKDANGNFKKDSNGNVIPSKIGSKIMEDYDAAAGNYSTVSQTAEALRAQGASKDDILTQIRAAYKTGILNANDYGTLYNRYRNLNASTDFGTAYVNKLNAAQAAATQSTKTTGSTNKSSGSSSSGGGGSGNSGNYGAANAGVNRSAAGSPTAGSKNMGGGGTASSGRAVLPSTTTTKASTAGSSNGNTGGVSVRGRYTK